MLHTCSRIWPKQIYYKQTSSIGDIGVNKIRALLNWEWLGSQVVSMLDSGAEGPGFKSQSRRCRVTVLGKLFTPIVPVFSKQQKW